MPTCRLLTCLQKRAALGKLAKNVQRPRNHSIVLVGMERAKLTDGSRSKAAQACADGSATVGMLTSSIKNKIVRSEAYTRLKKAKKVCASVS